ncbi:MAG: MFS transporter [Anaerolineales bacterium]|nr:MFS transporter [Anaerolineales bacterium]
MTAVIRPPTRTDLRWVRALYVLFIGGMGFLLPFWGLFLRRQGLTGTQIGWINTVLSGTTLLAAAGWGQLSDRHGSRRLIPLALVLAAAATLLLRFQQGFWPLLLATGAYGAMYAGIMPLIYARAYDLTEQMKGIGFGSIRVWGSIGWIVIVLTGGWLIEQQGLGVSFYGQAGAYLLAAAVACFIRFTPRPAAAQCEEEESLTSWKNPRLLLLAAAVAVAWLARVGPLRFEGIYLDELGAGEWLIGVVSMSGAVVEIPAMFWADHLLKRQRGLTILRIAWIIEIVLLALILVRPAVPTFIAARAVGGIAFSFYSVALVRVVGRMVPNNTTARWMAIFTVTLPSLMEIVGSVTSGAAYDAFGAYWLYVIGLICNVVAVLLLLALGRLPAKLSPVSSPLE